MKLDEAIAHATEVASKKYAEGMLCHANPNDKELDGCIKCAEEHEQLAKWLEELQQYREIGTVEECRAAVERQIAKKPIKRSFIVPYEGIEVCPNCKEPISKREHHCKCGQKIDWGEEE